jgi:hypothetical protein
MGNSNRCPCCVHILFEILITMSAILSIQSYDFSWYYVHNSLKLSTALAGSGTSVMIGWLFPMPCGKCPAESHKFRDLRRDRVTFPTPYGKCPAKSTNSGTSVVIAWLFPHHAASAQLNPQIQGPPSWLRDFFPCLTWDIGILILLPLKPMNYCKSSIWEATSIAFFKLRTHQNTYTNFEDFIKVFSRLFMNAWAVQLLALQKCSLWPFWEVTHFWDLISDMNYLPKPFYVIFVYQSCGSEW